MDAKTIETYSLKMLDAAEKLADEYRQENRFQDAGHILTSFGQLDTVSLAKLYLIIKEPNAYSAMQKA